MDGYGGKNAVYRVKRKHKNVLNISPKRKSLHVLMHKKKMLLNLCQ
jgi:hypothetical protein